MAFPVRYLAYKDKQLSDITKVLWSYIYSFNLTVIYTGLVYGYLI
mgnify:CR=1